MRYVLMVCVLMVSLLNAEDFNSTSVVTQEKILELCKKHKEKELKQYKNNPLWKDRKFVYDYAGKCIYTLEFADKNLTADREIVEHAIALNGVWGYYHAAKKLKEDRSIVEMATKRDINVFQYLPLKFRDDKELALNVRGGQLRYLSDRLRNDREVVSMAVKNSAENLKYADSRLRNDKVFILKMINSEKDFGNYLSSDWQRQSWIEDIIKYLGKSLRTDKDIMAIAMKQNIEVLEYADDSFKDNKNFMLKIIMRHGNMFKFASERLKKDKEIVSAAISQDIKYLQYADEEIRGDRDFILKLLDNHNYDVMEYISKDLKDNKDFFSFLFKRDSYKYYTSLDYASKRLQKDREIVLLAVKHDSSNIRYADKSFLSDREIVLLGIERNGNFLKYIDKKFFNDKEIIAKAFDDDRESLKYASDALKNDREFMLQRVKKNGYAYDFIGDSLKKDKELAILGMVWDEERLKNMDMIFRDNPEMVLKAMEQDTKYLQYASDRLRNDKTFIFDIIKYNPYALKYVTKVFKSNKNIMLEAIAINAENYRWMDETLKEDRDICLSVVGKKGDLLKSLPKKYISDREVVETAVSNDGLALKYAANMYKNDKDIVKKAVEKNGFSLNYASLKLKKDKELIALARKHSALYNLTAKHAVVRTVHPDAWSSYIMADTLEILYGKDANFTKSEKFVVTAGIKIKTDLKLKSIAILQEKAGEKNLMAWYEVHDMSPLDVSVNIRYPASITVVAEGVDGTLYIDKHTVEPRRYGCGTAALQDRRRKAYAYDKFFNAHLKRKITYEENKTKLDFMVAHDNTSYKEALKKKVEVDFITKVRVAVGDRTVFTMYTSEYIKENPYFNITLTDIEKGKITIYCTDVQHPQEYEYKDNLGLRRKIVNPWKR